jgi:hypothetical protein
MGDQDDETDETQGLFRHFAHKWQGDKPLRWITLSKAVDLVATTLNTSPAVAGALLLSEAIPPTVPWVKYAITPQDEGIKLVEIDPSLLIHASFDFRQGLFWIDDEGWDLQAVYVEQNHLEAKLEKIQSEHLRNERDRFVRFARRAIDNGVRGDKPPRWIDLYKAVRLIRKTLGILPGVAQELLQTQAIPPAVPWKGEVSRTWSNGMTFLMPTEIRRAEVIVADIHWGAGSMKSPASEGIIFEIRIEQNHLETWLEKKRPALVAQLAPLAPVSEDRVSKNKGKGGRPASSLRADVPIRLTAFVEKRGEPWVKHQTTSQLAKEVRAIFEKKNPPVDLGPRRTLEDWIGQWRSERGL